MDPANSNDIRVWKMMMDNLKGEDSENDDK